MRISVGVEAPGVLEWSSRGDDFTAKVGNCRVFVRPHSPNFGAARAGERWLIKVTGHVTRAGGEPVSFGLFEGELVRRDDTLTEEEKLADRSFVVTFDRGTDEELEAHFEGFTIRPSYHWRGALPERGDTVEVQVHSFASDKPKLAYVVRA